MSVPRLRFINLLTTFALVLTAVALPSAGAADERTAGSASPATARAAQAGAAQRFPVGGPDIEAAKAVAAAYWGAQACGGKVTMAWTPLDPGTNATASWRNPTDAWNNPAQNFDCRIDINPAADYDYPKLCTVLVHEFGHLLGRQHEGVGLLMSAFYTEPIAECGGASAPAAPAPEPAYDEESQVDGLDIVATEAPRRALTKKAAKKTKKVKRCVMRKTRSGKRVKRCTTVKARKATKTRR